MYCIIYGHFVFNFDHQIAMAKKQRTLVQYVCAPNSGASRSFRLHGD